MDPDKELTIWHDPPRCQPFLTLVNIFNAVFSILLTSLGIAGLIMPNFVVKMFVIPHKDKLQGYQCRDRRIKYDFCQRIDERFVLKRDHLTELFIYIAWYLIYLGAFNFLCMLMSFLSTWRLRRKLMIVSLCLIPISLTYEFNLINFIYFPNNPTYEAGKDEYVELFKTNYVLQPKGDAEFIFTMLYNTIMIVYKCCGIRHSDDARKPPLKHYTFVIEEGYKEYDLPPACCTQEENGYHYREKIEYIRYGKCESNSTTNKWDWHQQGCFDAIFHFFYERYGKHLLVVACFIIFCHSAQWTLTLLTLFQRGDKEVVYKNAKTLEALTKELRTEEIRRQKAKRLTVQTSEIRKVFISRNVETNELVEKPLYKRRHSSGSRSRSSVRSAQSTSV